MPLIKKLDPNECWTVIRNPNGRDSAELKQYFYNGSFTCFDGLSFQIQTEKK